MGMKYNTVLSREEIEELWGGPLPELEQVYYDMAAEFTRGRGEVAPYVMKKFYTLEEAEICMALPAESSEIAEGFGRTPEEMEKLLYHMARCGKILKTGSIYRRIPDIPYFKNSKHIQREDPDLCDQAGARLVIAWDDVEITEDGYIGGREPQSMRIFPKWEAVKDLPGVMPCENFPEILRENADRVVIKRCPCRAITSYARYGKDEGDICRHKPQSSLAMKDGVCIGFGNRQEDSIEMMDAYRPDRAELEQLIERLEQSGTYYCTVNFREVTGFCCCCDDCDCGVRVPYDKGYKDFYAKSRFIARVAHEEFCVGCGTCEEYCNFAPAVKVEDGVAKIDPELCHGCGNCAVNCPTGAIRMKLVRPAEHIPSYLDYDPAMFRQYGENITKDVNSPDGKAH